MDIVAVVLAAILGFLIGFELKEYFLKRRLSKMVRSRFGGKQWEKPKDEEE